MIVVLPQPFIPEITVNGLSNSIIASVPGPKLRMPEIVSFSIFDILNASPENFQKKSHGLPVIRKKKR